MPVNNEFTQRLKTLRSTKNLTQKQFSSLIGISEQSVIRWEKGSIKPGLEPIQKICEAFPDLSPEWLVMGRGPMVSGVAQYIGEDELAVLNLLRDMIPDNNNMASLVGSEEDFQKLTMMFGMGSAVAHRMGLDAFERLLKISLWIVQPLGFKDQDSAVRFFDRIRTRKFNPEEE